MKRVLAVFSLVVLACGYAAAQQPYPYRVVFDLTSRDTLDQKAVLRWIDEITRDYPKAELEVVMYGKGVEMAVPERSIYIEGVKAALEKPNVSFKVCQIALKNNKIDESQILKGVQPVADGIYEIISKQREQWGYIKVGH